MASLILRVNTAAGQTTKNAALTNSEIDNNFNNLDLDIQTRLLKAGGTLTGKLTFSSSTTTASSANLPSGTAPTTPAVGDIWATTDGIFYRTSSTVTKTLAFTDSAISTASITSASVFGSSAASGTLTLSSTSNATKGTVVVGDTGDTVRLGATTTNGAVYTTGGNGTLTVGTLPVASGGTGVTTSTGTGSVVLSSSPLLSATRISTSATVSAAGTTQATATALTSDYVVVTTAAANAGIALPTATVGRSVTIANRTANTILVYPATGAAIDSLGANVALSIQSGGYVKFIASTATQWYSTSMATTIADNSTFASVMYPAMASVTSGVENTFTVTSSKLTFVPSTGVLSATDFDSTSDAVLKENITPLQNALDTIKQISGYSFNFIESKLQASGVIAQEVEQVIPHLVKTGPNGKTVSYNQIIAYLIESVKELSAELTALKNK